MYWLCTLSRQEKNFSILLYHSVDLNDAPANVDPKQFEIQMEYLRRKYAVVSLQKIVSFVKEGKTLPRKPVAITFDDGYYSIYQNAYPILRKYRLPATVFVATGYVQKRMPLNNIQLRMLGWNEIKEMSENDVAIGAHTITHPDLEQIDLDTVKKEILGSREEIEKNVGREVRYFASPKGRENEDVASLIRSLGFDCAFGRISSKVSIQKGAGRLVLNRTEIDSSVAFWMFKIKLTKAVDWYRMFERGIGNIIKRLPLLSRISVMYNVIGRT